MSRAKLLGERTVLKPNDMQYPASFHELAYPPQELYVLGSVDALAPGLAVVGARKATPYGRSCAQRFARLAAQKGIPIISGGARGCDSEAHRAALGVEGPTVVFMGGGLDNYYPASHKVLFQEIIDKGGALVSEYPWDANPQRFMFRERNRLIAALARAVLIVEAGLPSGTFSTADEALSLGKEVLVVPGSIASPLSHGSNQLLFQGAIPIIDDASFEEVLFTIFGALKYGEPAPEPAYEGGPLLQALLAQPLSMEDLYTLACQYFGADAARERMTEVLAEAEARHLIARHANGKWGPIVQT